MTTIACTLKEIAADTRVGWEGVGTDAFIARKIYSTERAIYGVSGEDCTGSLTAIKWLQSGKGEDFKPLPPDFDHGWDWRLIELSAAGIAVYNERLEQEITDEPFLAIGSGRKVAMYCMKEMGMSPAEAVREACKVDHFSELPIYHAKLSDRVVKRWTPTKTKRKAKR
jgi:hypothetical protein